MVEAIDGEFFRTGVNSVKSEQSLDVSLAELLVTKKPDQSVIAHLIAHSDGAAIFSTSGKLLSIKNWLNAAPDSDDVIANGGGGTRQLSALTASRFTSLPVVTVSADGPVRAYFKGKKVRGY